MPWLRVSKCSGVLAGDELRFEGFGYRWAYKRVAGSNAAPALTPAARDPEVPRDFPGWRRKAFNSPGLTQVPTGPHLGKLARRAEAIHPRN
jgi:hypothetical protein